MKHGFWLLFLFIFNCSSDPQDHIEHLEGYWEIEEVILPNGEKKGYRFNETIDYIDINDSLEGFRKKLKPGINDTYYTSDSAEALKIKIENDSLNLYYSTALSEWKETVLEASEDMLKVVNNNNVTYIYKRYTPINLTIEE